MGNQDCTGTWHLTGTLAWDSEIPFVGDELKPGAVEEWLLGQSDDRIGAVIETQGLTLTIRNDDTFTEEKTGDPQITWFDSEGVLESEVIPFDGKIQWVENRGYLTLANPDAFAAPDDPENRARIRYDDGDTKISDIITFIDGALLRTVSVVTDELYLNRILLKYERNDV